MATELTIFQETARRLGKTVLPDNAQWEMRMEIHSQTSDRVYVVSRRKSDKTWGCGCPGWRTRRHCKHLDVIVPAIEAALRAVPKRVA